jgi:hypothetical protein
MGTARRDYLAQVSTSSSRSKWCKALHRGLDERTALLGLQETDLEVREGIMAEELEHGLHHSYGHNLLMELYNACTRANEIAGDQAVEAERLSRQLMRVVSVLIDLGLSPIEYIPQLPKTVLECLQGALDSSAGPWD